MDFRLNNGKPKCTIIQRFDRSILLVGPAFGQKKTFKEEEIGEVKPYAQKRGWEINVEHLHPGQNEKA